jgi:hypothetical protein
MNNPCEKHLNVRASDGYCPICLLDEIAQLRAERDEMRVIIQAVSDHDDYIGRKTVMQVIDDWLAKYPAHPETKEEK